MASVVDREQLALRLPVAFLNDVAASENSERLLGVLAKWVPAIIPSERCSVTLVEYGGDGKPKEKMRHLALAGIGDMSNTALPLTNSNPGLAVLSRKPVVIPDMSKSPYPVSRKLASSGLKSSICVPILSGERSYGSINIGHHELAFYDNSDAECLLALAGWIANQLRLIEQVELLDRQAKTDFLTGVDNRLAFAANAETLFADWQASGRGFALVLLDLDHFKRINDTHGHQIGDQVLVSISKKIASRKRQSDIFARIGGEEFALLLPDRSFDHALQAAEIYRSVVAQTSNSFEDLQLRVTASAGLDWPCEDDHSFDHLHSRVDDFLYQAKQAGRDRLVAPVR